MEIKKFIIIASVIISLSLGIFPVSVIAEINNSDDSTPLKVVNCFDYYHFGNIGITIAPEKESTLGRPIDAKSLPASEADKPYILMGTKARFAGQISNPESYPIVNGSVYVKIFKRLNDALNPNSLNNENLLVDQFYAAKGVNVGSKKQASFSFDWQVPSNAPSGDYYIASYFISGDKFNSSGLYFSDSVTGGTGDFSIIGADDGSVFFNKDSVKVDNQKYTFTQNSPRINDGAPITITFNLDNKTGSEQRIPVSYTLYGGDELKTENILNTTSELAIIKAGSSKNLSYTISDKNHAVYYLVAEARFKDTKSIIDVRAIRDNVNQLSISYLTTGSYPLSAKNDNTIMACVVNKTSSFSAEGKLTLSVLDKGGRTLWSADYKGEINGAMMGLEGAFKPRTDISNFKVKAELYDGSNLVDEAILPYDCKALDPDLCKGVSGQGIFLIIIIILLIGGAAFLILKKTITRDARSGSV